VEYCFQFVTRSAIRLAVLSPSAACTMHAMLRTKHHLNQSGGQLVSAYIGNGVNSNLKAVAAQTSEFAARI
jgi:hypothetical protein